jgi:hypothetical protein
VEEWMERWMMKNEWVEGGTEKEMNGRKKEDKWSNVIRWMMS